MISKKAKNIIRKNIAPLITGLFCLLLTYLLTMLKFIKNFENFLLDTRFSYKSHLTHDIQLKSEAIQSGAAIKIGKKINSPMMIFGIDEGSLNQLGRWPWPRSIHKEFLDFFYTSPDFKNKPYLIFYDIFFEQYASLLIKEQNVKAIKSFISNYINKNYIKNLQNEKGIRENQLKEISSEIIIGELKDILKNTIDDPIFFNKLKEINEHVKNNENNENHRGGFVITDFMASRSILGRFAPEIVAERLNYLKDTIIPVKNPEVFRHAIHQDIKPPVVEVLQNTSGCGAAQVYADEDGIVRKMPLIYLFYDDRTYTNSDGKKVKVTEKPIFLATVTLLIAMKYFNVTSDRVEVILGKYIRLKDAKVPIYEREYEKIEGFDPIPKGWKIKEYSTRDIIIPINNIGQMMINFQGEHASFENQPYQEGVIMQRQKNFDNQSLYKNRIILIGFYTSAGLGEGRDYFPTPYKTLYGIEVHANALYTIFENKFLYQINPTVNIIIYVFLLILFGLLLPRIKIWKGFILFIITYLAIFFGGLILFSEFSIIINMISLMAFVLFLFLFITVYRLLTEEKEKRQIKGMFAQYVNPEVVTELMLDPDKLQLGGEDRELTVLFSDIRGFTTISENLSPQQLVQVLNTYLSDMTDLLFEYRGTLDKYIGDAVMAFWGAPVPIKHHAVLAADTSLRMMEKLQKLNEKMYNDPEYSIFKEKNIKLDIGIGLNSGIMTVGNMGSLIRKNYTIMGDAVNLGSRLEGVNKVYGTNIIISEFTYELIKDYFICREIDYIRVKGKKLPVKIYELLDRKENITSEMIKKLD